MALVSDRGVAARLARRTKPAPLPAEGWTGEAGRHAFFGAFGDLARQRHYWQIASFVLMGVVLFLVVAYVRLASASRITPYVVEVDRVGSAVAMGPAERAQNPEARMMIWTLGYFIKSVRSIYRDPVALTTTLHAAYAFVPAPGADTHSHYFLDSYFQRPENDPRNLAKNEVRIVEVTSVLEEPDQKPGAQTTWRIRWQETTIAEGSNIAQRSAWEASALVRVIPPKDLTSVQLNPLGIFVTELNWGRIGAPEEVR